MPTGVQGPGEGGGGEPSGPTDTRFRCDEGAAATPPGRALQRLTRREYENTLRGLLISATSEETGSAVLAAVQSDLALYVPEGVTGSTPFPSMVQHVPQVDVLLRIGESIARQLTSSPERIAELLGGCEGASCIDDFIASFGKRALRHALNEAERDFYREVYGSAGATVDARALSDVIAVMLSAPEFVYRIEYAPEKPGSGKTVPLGDYEIATRLSFTFWRSGPDDALLAAADRGELRSDEGFARALDRVLADPRARDGLRTFSREWFGLDKSMEPLDKNAHAPAFQTLAGGQMPSAETKESLLRELDESLAYHTLVAKDSLSEWLASPYSFATDRALAGIYETGVWDGRGTPPRFPAHKRAGLITRAALVATRHGTASTSPILKGVLIRERLLCDRLGPPENNRGTEAVSDVTAATTTRKLVESITGSATCARCHASGINPLGFATENYDALGRVRTAQDFYDEQGRVMGSLPVDTTSEVSLFEGRAEPSQGAADLTRMLVESGKVERCFAIEWLRSAEGREVVDMKGTPSDGYGCQLEPLRASLRAGSLVDALRGYAMRPAFRQRVLP